jgi:hypothetical protein
MITSGAKEELGNKSNLVAQLTVTFTTPRVRVEFV